VELSISTATPSSGGSPPELLTLRYNVRDTTVPNSSSYGSAQALSNPMYAPSSNSNALFSNALYSDNNKLEASYEEPVLVQVTQVKQQSTATTFTIPRKATILCDKKPHKVTITIVELTATYSYTCIPFLQPNAYIRATCINSSEFPLLPGKISVFLDNNFVANSTLKHCNPRDEFFLHLGIDPAVVVNVKPEFKVKENKGVIKKTQTDLINHIIVIKNTKTVPVHVIVFDRVPLSDTSQLKVKVIEPDLEQKNLGYSINDYNNLKWERDIEPSKESTFSLRYSMEYPADFEFQLVSK